MEIVLEQDEVDSLLRQALQARGILVPHDARLTVRHNHKHSTIRLVYITEEPHVPGPDPGKGPT